MPSLGVLDLKYHEGKKELGWSPSSLDYCLTQGMLLLLLGMAQLLACKREHGNLTVEEKHLILGHV